MCDTPVIAGKLWLASHWIGHAKLRLYNKLSPPKRRAAYSESRHPGNTNRASILLWTFQSIQQLLNLLRDPSSPSCKNRTLSALDKTAISLYYDQLTTTRSLYYEIIMTVNCNSSSAESSSSSVSAFISYSVTGSSFSLSISLPSSC